MVNQFWPQMDAQKWCTVLRFELLGEGLCLIAAYWAGVADTWAAVAWFQYESR